MQSSNNQINKILTEYRSLANLDPHLLRAIIPSKEIWRFFIDGRRQENCRNFKADALFQKKPYFYGLLSFDPLHYTISQYVKRVEQCDPDDTDSMTNSKLMTLLDEVNWSITKPELEQLKLIDLLNMDKAWLPFERNEPGYLKALIKGFNKIVDCSIPLTLDFIKELHKTAVKNVNGTQYIIHNLDDRIGEFRSHASVNFGLSSRNTSVFGLDEFIERIMHHDLSSANSKQYLYMKLGGCNGFELNEESLNLIKNLSWSTALTDDKALHDIFVKFAHGENSDAQKLSVDLALPLLKKLISRKYCFCTYLYGEVTSNDIYFKSQQATDTQQELTKRMQVLLDTYHNTIAKDDDPLSKLETIINFIQSCEQLHPFSDGNCRTFCMLLLNHLLIKNGFPLAILEDPNRFDMYSKDELLDEVIHGMQNTIELIRTGKLYNIKTDDVLTYLNSKQVLNIEVTYFNYIIDIEEKARAERKQQYKNNC